MKIAMLTDRLALGGGPECIRLIARHLPQHEYTVFAAGGTLPALEALPNVKIERKFPTRQQLADFEVIHCHHLRPLVRLRAPKGVPVINTVHGIHSRKFEFGTGLPNAVRGVLRRTLERRLFSHVTVNIVLTPEDREWLELHYKLTNLVKIPNGIEVNTPEVADRTSLRNELLLPESRHCLMMIARFEILKGYDVLLEAVKLAADSLRRNNVTVVLIGDGQDRTAFEALAHAYHLDDLLFFCGGRPEARRFLPLADGLLLPSRWEGLPLIALEAGVYNVPVIGAAAPGIVSLLSDGKTGRLFPLEDAAALGALLADETLFESLPALGKAWHEEVSAHYNVTTMAAAHDALYRSVVRGSNS